MSGIWRRDWLSGRYICAGASFRLCPKARLAGYIRYIDDIGKYGMVYDRDMSSSPDRRIFMTIYPKMSWRIGRYEEGRISPQQQQQISIAIASAFEELNKAEIALDWSAEFERLQAIGNVEAWR